MAGVSAADLEQLATLYAEANPAVVRCGWGLERNRNGGSAVAAVLALPAVAGKFGVRGGGYTMSNSVAWDVDPAAAACAPPPATRVINMNRVGQSLAADFAPAIRALFVYNCNPLATLPAQNKVRAGLEREDLFTVVHEQVMTDTARYADVLLPATTFLEHSELRRGYGSMLAQRATGDRAGGRSAARTTGCLPSFADGWDLARRASPKRRGDRAGDRRHVARRAARVAAELAATGRGASVWSAAGAIRRRVSAPRPTARSTSARGARREAPAGLVRLPADPATQRVSADADFAEHVGCHFVDALRARVERQVPRRAAPGRRGRNGASPTATLVRVFNGDGEVRALRGISDELRPGVAMLPKGLWAKHTRNGQTANALSPDTLTDLGGGACFNDARVEIRRDNDG